MTNATELMAQIERTGESLYSASPLASGHRQVTGRVRRHRAVRAGAGTVAGVGVLGAAGYGLASWNSTTDLAPASPSASAPSKSPSAIAVPAVTFVVEDGDQAVMVLGSFAQAWGLSEPEARAAITAALPDVADGQMEGWLRAGEWSTSQYRDARDMADAMVASTVANLQNLGVAEDDWQSTLTVASILTQEIPMDEDLPMGARVIENRLSADMPLQLDSTLRYDLGLLEGPERFTTQEQRDEDSPYNSYVYPGLPPTPIGSPSLEALAAAANPADGDWLYFVVVDPDTGETEFAVTYDEHINNVMVLQEWVAANEG